MLVCSILANVTGVNIDASSIIINLQSPILTIIAFFFAWGISLTLKLSKFIPSFNNLFTVSDENYDDAVAVVPVNKHLIPNSWTNALAVVVFPAPGIP